jgi:hypothetical protein
MPKTVAEPRNRIEAFRMTESEQARLRAVVPRSGRSDFMRTAIMSAISKAEAEKRSRLRAK